MTITDMHRRVEQECFHVDGLFPERIDEILNDAIDDFVRAKLPKKRNPFQEGIDDSVLAAKDLDSLKVFRESLPLDNSLDGHVSVEFPLPQNCLYPLGFDTELHYSITARPATENHPRKISHGRMVDVEFAGEYMLNTIEKSNFKSPAAVLADGSLRLLKDKSFIIKGLYLTYLRKPARVSVTSNPTVDCDLPESVHRFIVNRAIANILENSESERLQTKAALNQTNE
jgi:hypothetical protein